MSDLDDENLNDGGLNDDGHDQPHGPSQTAADAAGLPVPAACFHSVQFPGYARDHKQLLHTMGGMHAIQAAFAQEPGYLEINYAPSNPFVHPISGEILPTANLLLKVVRRTHRRTGAVSMHHQIVGVISKTCRFRALADFQFQPDPADPIVKLRHDMQALNANSLREFQLDTSAKAASLRQIPPPAFSRTQWPSLYSYKENPTLIKKHAGLDDHGKPKWALTEREEHRKVPLLTFSPHRDSQVPTAPMENIQVTNDMIPVINALNELFATRPIWLRQAIINTLDPAIAQSKCLKFALTMVGFVITAGVWRGTWVKFGYDPRTDPSSRIYQVVDMRSIKSQRHELRAKRMGHVGDITAPMMAALNAGSHAGAASASAIAGRAASPAVGGPSTPSKPAQPSVPDSPSTPTQASTSMHSSRTEDARRSHIFDGKTFSEVAWIQLCDVTDPELQSMIHSPQYCSETYNDKDGWYLASHAISIRKTMVAKIKELQGRPAPWKRHGSGTSRRDRRLASAGFMDLDVSSGDEGSAASAEARPPKRAPALKNKKGKGKAADAAGAAQPDAPDAAAAAGDDGGGRHNTGAGESSGYSGMESAAENELSGAESVGPMTRHQATSLQKKSIQGAVRSQVNELMRNLGIMQRAKAARGSGAGARGEDHDDDEMDDADDDATGDARPSGSKAGRRARFEDGDGTDSDMEENAEDGVDDDGDDGYGDEDDFFEVYDLDDDEDDDNEF
ncbi:RNA polymerase III transcription factor IIIC subunit-domain-containing protein [Entophlyctis helioformis]|nr:RNA polymerase III transcription factor IIIC subunit-domain-containing protein [Entophlyctis helioformis]